MHLVDDLTPSGRRPPDDTGEEAAKEMAQWIDKKASPEHQQTWLAGTPTPAPPGTDMPLTSRDKLMNIAAESDLIDGVVPGDRLTGVCRILHLI